MADGMLTTDSPSPVSADRWRLLVNRREALLPAARQLCSSPADAEDVVHEALLRAARFAHLDENRIDQFLHTVVGRLATDLHRRRRRDRRLTEHGALRPGSEESPEEGTCERHESTWSIKLLLDGLPSRQRHIVHRTAAGLSQGQIAAELGISRKAVESALARARNRLRAIVAAQES